MVVRHCFERHEHRHARWLARSLEALVRGCPSFLSENAPEETELLPMGLTALHSAASTATR
jgi:hypothetical protein